MLIAQSLFIDGICIVIGELGTILMKSYVVKELVGSGLWPSNLTLTFPSSCASPLTLPTDFGTEVDVAVRECFVGGLLNAGADLAIGNDKPLNFPRLATPTPQVNCVLYPEHSVPN